MKEYQRIQPINDKEGQAINDGKSKPGRCASCSLLALFFLAILAGLVAAVVFIITNPQGVSPKPVPCTDPCTVILAESMPLNLTFPDGSPRFQSTFAIWKELLATAEETIDISSYYWTLRGKDIFNDTSDFEGEEIFQELMAAGTTRNISIRIVENKPSHTVKDYDTKELVAKGAAEVRALDFDKLLGGGILHTKFWVVDNKHLYLGSANMDYRALTQVKEIGVGIFNCSCLAEDLDKLFEVYWYLGNHATVPPKWPKEFATAYNLDTPMELKLNETNATAFIGSSPPAFCPTGRTSDIDGLLNVVESARKFVYIAVMDYIPEKEFAHPMEYWDVIDAKLREVAFNHHINVRVMGSIWNHTSDDMIIFLRSLAEMGATGRFNIQAKLFCVPAYTPVEHIMPYARVNHNKYMVTDNAAYIGTSNWSGTYFTLTGGASLVVNQTLAQMETNATTLQGQLAGLFERDWNSIHALPVLHNVECV
nr:5'-3' exonuclease PLD3-like [Lytechinus pictus]